MKKTIVVSGVLSIVAIVMIGIAISLHVNVTFNEKSYDNVLTVEEVDIKSMALANRLVKVEATHEQLANEVIEPVEMAQTAQSVKPLPPRVEVYENMTLEELSEKLNRSLKSTLAGKGYLVASESLKYGVDPYMATAIMLHETGCNWQCSQLVINCNNVGGQKGGPSCGGGSYKSYPTLDEGIIGFISNLSVNYYAHGLTTPETIGPKYAASSVWSSKIYSYMNSIRAK